MSKNVSGNVPLGRIVGLFGVKGWVKVFSYTDPREALLDYDTWWLGPEGQETPVRLEEGKRHGKAVIARLADTEDRDQAAAWLDTEISVPRSELPDPEGDSFYWSDLEGLRVVRKDGTELGSVAYLLETGTHDVLVVQGDSERLIPFVMDEIIVDVDLGAGEITVDWEWD